MTFDAEGSLWVVGGGQCRRAQKAKYEGEFFPAPLPEGSSGKLLLEFFQTDKETGRAKGIVAIDLRELES